MAKKYLMDVVLIRLTLIFLLVFYHAFCPFTGSWSPPSAENFHIIEVYRWIGAFSYQSKLEVMVFISGLLFGYTLTLHPERMTFNNCVLKKAKRILLPGLLFSILYYLLFYDLYAPWPTILHKLLNGCGHLWFLPMIFWCFVVSYLLELINTPPIIPQKVILIFCGIMLFFPWDIRMMGLGRVSEYFFYFYLGFAMKRGYVVLLTIKRRWGFLMMPVLILLLSACNKLVKQWMLSEIIKEYLVELTHLLCAVCMIIFLYSLANRPRVQQWLHRHPILITLSGYCYGVYIYQQFILIYLYYHTPFATWVSSEAFPWIGFLFTVTLSLILCHLTQKTRLGRYLIG